MNSGLATNEGRPGVVWRAAIILLLGVYALSLYLTAWVAEDAFITFRTIENWFQGHGLRWNVAERTQTYSHPLWLGLLSAGRAISGELYFSSMALGGLCSLAAIAVLLRKVSMNAAGAMVALAVLVFSKTFVEYSTSGLEGPLTHLLLALFAWVCLAPAEAESARLRRFFQMTLLLGLAGINRMDSVLLFGPAWAMAALRLPLRPMLRRAFLGLLPFLGWLTFSTVYYGSPLPVTAYAKAFHGIPSDALWAQGYKYYADIAVRDPLLLPAMGLGLLSGLWFQPKKNGWLVLGALLYCLYVAKIGGGFMAGRFLTPPLFVAAIMWARIPFSSGKIVWPVACTGVTALAGLLCPTAPLFAKPTDHTREVPESGIVDERAFHYQRTGLRSPVRNVPVYGSAGEILGVEVSAKDPLVFVWMTPGLDGYMAGPDFHLVDPLLCDPFLMRLPVENPNGWRVGHFKRAIPEGYLESLISGEIKIRDGGLALFYADIRLAVRGPLFTKERWKAISRISFGPWRSAFRAYALGEYRKPPLVGLTLEQLSGPVPDGTSWTKGAGHLIGRGGVRVTIEEPCFSKTITVGLDATDVYSFTFLRGGEELGSLEVADTRKLLSGIGQHTVEVPVEASEKGFDEIVVRVVRSHPDYVAVLAYLELD